MNEVQYRQRATLFGLGLLVVGLLIFIFVTLLGDPEALKDSIYTYYFDHYYRFLSKGMLPWIQFNFEYPPMAAFALMFPAFYPGMSVLAITILRALVALAGTGYLVCKVAGASQIDQTRRTMSIAAIGAMGCTVPGFYFGLFDWTMCFINLILALGATVAIDPVKTARLRWLLVWLGASIKMLPLIAIPFLLKRSDAIEKRSALPPFVATLVLHAPFFIFGFAGFRYFVGYHRMRGIDNFSLYSTFLFTLESLGIKPVDAKWNFGALELQGSTAMIFAKLSLPIFLLILLVLWVTQNKQASIKERLGLYSIALLVYPAVSKVAQSNYVVWTIASIASVWLLGFGDHRFLKITGVGAGLSILIGWYQNARFEDYLMPAVPGVTLVIAWVRFGILFALAFLCWTTIRKEAKNMVPNGANLLKPTET